MKCLLAQFLPFLIVLFSILLVNGELENGQIPLAENLKTKVLDNENLRMKDGWFFWDYTTSINTPVLNGDIRLRPGLKTELKLESGDMRSFMGYGFIVPSKWMRLSISCVDFNIPCEEGSLTVVSKEHRQTFCGGRRPWNYISSTKYMYVKFVGMGGPYTGNLRCFISGIKGTDAENPLFTPLSDDVTCPEALADPSTYSTVEAGCGCGTENSTGLAGRSKNARVAGTVSDPHSHPFMAVIHGKGSTVSEFHCSGVLISDLWVLTTASCVRHIPVENLEVNLGNHDILDYSTGTSYGVVESVGVGFNIFTREGDLFMLKLDSAIDLTASWQVKPICLPNPCVDLDGSMGYIAGWGGTVPDQVQSDVLNVADVTIMTNTDCNTSYNGAITEKMVCGTPVACTKDSGAPLWRINSKGRAELVGIHSWADGCDVSTSKPGVFTRVSAFSNEIINTLLATSGSVVCSP